MNIILRSLLIFTLLLPAADAADRYFNTTVIPAIDQLQENALAAVRSADPKQLGNALLMLILTRSELSSTPTLPEERRTFLQNIATSLKLATKDKLEKFRSFLDQSKSQAPEKQSWIPATRAALLRFERHITDADPLGKWLPSWVNVIPLLPAADALPPAWTWRGHAAAKELVEAANAETHWRASALAEYRNNALAAWRGEAAKLWDDIPATIPDADIPARLREIAEGEDPASRFAKSAAEHLLPMFGEEKAHNPEPPEITWLRRFLQQETPAKPLSRHIDEATRQAEARTAALNAAAGAPVWPTLSPLAADVYARHLQVRQSALELNEIWQRTVYTPSRFSPATPEESRDRLVAFLTGSAHGFWLWRESGDIDNARTHGIPFSFSREFLTYCNAMLAAARTPALTELPLTFAVTSVTAAGENVIEHPTAAHFRLGTEREGQTLSYRNYPSTADWTWTPEIDEAEIRLTFPSHTAAIRFTTPAELKKFYTLFGEGRCILTPDDFDPDSAPALRRLGVEEITFAATLSNLEKLFPQLNRTPLPPLPMRIITKRGND